MGKSQKQPDDLHAMRHSLAHILAYAVKDIFKDVKFGIGPVIENGFFYDFNLDEAISEDDLGKIEKRMQEIIRKDYRFEKEEIGLEEAKNKVNKQNQPYKEELVGDIISKGSTDVYAEEGEKDGKVDKVSFYSIGEFSDLCRGGHMQSTGQVGVFKLTKVSGAYWRGNEKNAQMQRVYGVAFKTQRELDDHLKLLEEAKKRDHRKLGKELDLFTISDLVGPGLPLMTPRGSVLREELAKYSQELQEAYGFQRVWSPHIAKTSLYEKSGHYQKFPEKFEVSSEESSDKFMMKPMNCPHHIQIFDRKPWSYRDLPIRYMENTTNYRDEKHGELHGLSRVRSLSQDDGHVFCGEEDIEAEVSSIVSMVRDMYKSLGMEFVAHLSYRDSSDAYLGEKKLWEQAEKILSKVAKVEKLDYIEDTGEAAFYGPKIDFMIKDSLGRQWQCATIQLDFVLPERFDLTYVSSDGSKKRPVMIHKALLGSIERFMSVYIEHTGGKFPVWLAPEQVRFITVNQEDKTKKFAEKIIDKAKEVGIRISLDNDNESVGKKIRTAEIQKVPYIVVIGDKEIDSNKVVPRIRSDIQVQDKDVSYDIDNFLKSVGNEARSRTTKSSL